MGYAPDAVGKPVYTETPTQTVADLQAGADYAHRVGAGLRGTRAERLALSSGELEDGWLFTETDTANVYMRSPSGWELVGPGAFGVLSASATETVTTGATGLTMPFDSSTGRSLAFYDTGGDRVGFTAEYAGWYHATAYAGWEDNGTGVRQTQIRVNGSPRLISRDTAASGAQTYQNVSAPIQLAVNDVVTMHMIHSAGVTIYVAGRLLSLQQLT